MQYSFVIRKAEQADAEAIVDILKRSTAQYISTSKIPLSLEEMTEDVKTTLRDILETDVFIAAIDDVPVGTVRVDSRCEGKIAHLKRLGVVAGSQNIGIGKSLMNLVDKVLKERGVKAVELYTAAKNQMIMRFYYGRGYYVDSTTKDRGYIRALLRKDYN